MDANPTTTQTRPVWPQLTETESAAFRELLIHGPQSRVEISRRLHLTRASLTLVTRKLIEVGLVLEGNQELRGRTGRPSGMLFANSDAHRFLGVKLTGDSLFATITNLESTILASSEIPLPTHNFSEVVELIARTAAELETQTGPVTAAGVSVAGDVVNISGRAIVRNSTYLGWDGVPLGPELEALLQVPVAVLNDVRALTLGEHWFGAGAGCSSLVVITVGAGVGLGMVHNDELIEGARGYAGRGDHTIVDGSGPICALGHRGCVSAFMTNDALLRAAGKAGETYEKLVERARSGDAEARRAFTDAAYALGQYASQLADIMDPEVVIITGDGLAIAEIGMSELRRGVAAHRPDMAERINLSVQPFEFSEWARGSAVAAIKLVSTS